MPSATHRQRTPIAATRLTLSETQLGCSRAPEGGPQTAPGGDSGDTYTTGKQRKLQEAATRATLAAGITLQLLNVQSLLPKLPDVCSELRQRDSHILCYTETNLKTGTPDRLVNLPGYNIFRRDRIIGRKKSGGGVAIFTKETLQVTRVDSSLPACSRSHTETPWLNIKLDKRRSTIIEAIYRAPSTTATQTHSDFDHTEEQLQAIIEAHPTKRIMLAGDLNADVHTIGANRKSEPQNSDFVQCPIRNSVGQGQQALDNFGKSY